MAVLKALTILGTLVLSLVFLCLFELILWLQTELIRRQQAEEMNHAMSRWQCESRDYMNTIRSQRHDFNLHLHAISRLIHSGEYEGCRKYVRNLVLDANAMNDIMSVGDAIVGPCYIICGKILRRYQRRGRGGSRNLLPVRRTV